MRRILITVLGVAFLCALAAEAAEIPQVELQALDRAIALELRKNELGSQTLGDLQRLKFRLDQSRLGTKADALAVLEPLGAGGAAAGSVLGKLEKEAESGNRSALRSLALYHLYQNSPELARETWSKMGEANPNDLSYQILAAYLELALGEHNSARKHLEFAQQLVDTRSGLEMSAPVFCDNIAGYRLYVKKAPGDLLPGDNSLIYVEVDGADFFALPGGDFECRLMFGLKLTNEHGRVLWAEPNFGEYSPLFNGPVRDLHAALTWRVPNDLLPGHYTLVVEVDEIDSKRHGENRIEFNVAKRATNPEQKLSGSAAGGSGIDVNKAVQDASKNFPGATPYFQPNQDMNNFRNSEKYYDLMRQHERSKAGVER